MKTFQFPILSIHGLATRGLAMSLLGLFLLSGLDTPGVYADFTFGERVNLKSVVPVIDTTYGNIECFSYDRLEVYTCVLQRNRPGEAAADWDLCVQKQVSKDSAWGPCQNLGPSVNSPKEDSSASISADGLDLYFTSNRAGGYGGFDIYRTTRASKIDPWGPPANLGPTVNSSADDACSRISTDGLELYFASWRAGGYGDGDIYVARRATANNPWGEPVNLGPTVNSAYGETYTFLSPDGLLLFFSDNWLTSPRPGGYTSQDIWMTRRVSLSDPWQMPVNLGSRINEPTWNYAPRMSVDGRTFYYHTAVTLDPDTWHCWQVPILPIVDFNGDGQTDGKDVLCMASRWSTDDPMCDIGPFAWGDGTVDLQDLIALAEYLGKEVIDPTLVAHWALDESEGSAAKDSVSGEDSFVMGEPVWQPAGGQVAGALQLDGVDDCVVTSFVLDPSEGPFSVLAWIKGGAPGQVVVSHSLGMGDNCLMVDSEGRLMTELGSSNGANSVLSSQTVITDGKWHRIGFVWDGSYRHLYVDGAEVARDAEPLPGLESGEGGVYIGAGNGIEPGSLWSGMIDDVRIYNRVVSP